jgi:glucose-1-phosphate adenylyltransferase
MQDILSVILGGGRGARLYPLTRRRSEPAVPIAGKYRLIDIPISNCINSDVRRVYVVTQFLSVSVHRHIANTFRFDLFGRGFVEVLPAQQTNESADWYQGTADAIRQNIAYLEHDPGREVLILSGDQLYHMDFREMVRTHRENGADITIAVTPVPAAQAHRLGVVRLDAGRRITTLVEKPQTEAQLQSLRTSPEWLQKQGIVAAGREHLANMGIYLFNREVLIELLQARPLAHDLVNEVFARRLSSKPIQAHLFGGYWADVGTIRSYYEASLELAGENPPFNFSSTEGVIYTRMRNLPASRVEASSVRHCLISDGCVVAPGTRLEQCLVGVRSLIARNVVLRDAILIGADEYETQPQRDDNRRRGIPDIGIGENTVIERAIVDKDSRIGRNVRIVNERGLREADGPNFAIRDGIVVIPDRAVVLDGTVI